MNAELNLCEILKGHEGETFYSPIFGNLILNFIGVDSLEFTTINHDTIHVYSNGKFYDYSDEICVYPSSSLRDWNIWNKEVNEGSPKTWSELEAESNEFYRLEYFGNDVYSTIDGEIPIEKAALALLKIHQLIEVSYGGVPPVKKRLTILDNDTCDIDIDAAGEFQVSEIGLATNHIAFHTKEQAEEFLKYEENIQLLKDYFMV